MNGEMCVGCEYVTHHSVAGLQHQECNYPTKSHALITEQYGHIYFMHEDECPLKILHKPLVVPME